MAGNVSYAVRATDRCNLDCRYCYAKTACPKDMTLETLKRILEQMAGYSKGEIVVSWTGGEPLLMGRSFFEAIVEIQKNTRRKFVNILQTNAILLDDWWLNFLATNQFQVRTSLDLPPALHDEMRRQGNFEETIKKIKMLQAAGVMVNINTVITDRNIDSVDEMYDFLKKLSIKSFSVSRLVLQGNALKNSELAIKENMKFGQFLVRLFDLWVNDEEQPKIERITPLDKLMAACKNHLLREEGKNPCFHCQEQLLAIGPAGDLYPSCNKFFGLPETCLGDINTKSLPEILESEQRKVFLREVKGVTDKLCPDCEFFPICEGGCYYVAYKARPDLKQINRRDQFCKGYYIILARIMEHLKGGKK